MNKRLERITNLAGRDLPIPSDDLWWLVSIARHALRLRDLQRAFFSGIKSALADAKRAEAALDSVLAEDGLQKPLDL